MENEAHASENDHARRLAALAHDSSEQLFQPLLSDLSNLTAQTKSWTGESAGCSPGLKSLVDRCGNSLPIRNRNRATSTPQPLSSFVTENLERVTRGVPFYLDGPNDEISGPESAQPSESSLNLECEQTCRPDDIHFESKKLPASSWLQTSKDAGDLPDLSTWSPRRGGISTGNVPNPSFNFRLRPSQRPVICIPKVDQFRTADRLTSPRRAPAVSREIYLFSRPGGTTKRSRLARRRGPVDPLGPPAPRYAAATSPGLSFQDQNSRQVRSVRTPTALTVQLDSNNRNNRQVSGNSIWRVGGLMSTPREAPPRQFSRPAIHLQSRPQMHVSKFLGNSTRDDDSEMHRKRLALALDIDQSQKVLASPGGLPAVSIRQITQNTNTETRAQSAISIILEAPHLRDDFYCSVLAYSHRLERLAVALGCNIYLWSESTGVINTPSALDALPDRGGYVTSIAFSSEAGGRAILAVGRADGRIVLWSPLDEEPRYLKMKTPKAAANLSFRPAFVRRASQRHASLMAENEVLMVGDDSGIVSIYFVEWPEATKRFLFGWHGSICLHAKISVHTQQICGIAWSPSGDYFATGGNDNLCCLFQTSIVLAGDHCSLAPAIEVQRDARGDPHLSVITTQECDVIIRHEKVRHQWRLTAAIKAIAFCPWQRGLLAAGGGSNDRCIHFFHTMSGASLAAIDCAAQVTSLIWSETRREIAATFGFAQPDHPYRVAVYSWPSCQQMVAIPWVNEMRALHAIGYPGRPNGGRGQREGSTWGCRTAEEGCIVVAGSDGSIKFHEIWSEARSATAPRRGLLGGSDILESLHGIEKEGKETIR